MMKKSIFCRSILYLAALVFLSAISSTKPAFAGDACFDAFRRDNYATALRVCPSLAKQGNATAQTVLGLLYAEAKGVPQDFKMAARWYRMAAEQGEVDAQVFLAQLYADGLGVAQNFSEAAKWFGLAAATGDPFAQYGLGLMSYKGEGVPQDDKKALQLFRLAVEGGDIGASYMLATMYSNGRGGRQDNVLAYMWFDVSILDGPSDAKEKRDRLARKMSPADLAKARDLARSCHDNFYENCEERR